MKNKLNLKIFVIFIYFLHFLSVNSEELKFEASSIEIIDKDKIIIAKDGVKVLLDDEITIDANQMRYDKENKLLNAEGNIVIKNQVENIEIYSDNIFYDMNLEKIISSGNVEINFENNYTLKTEEINYLKKTAEVIINYPTKITDKFENEIELRRLNFNVKEKLLKGKLVNLNDKEKNF